MVRITPPSVHLDQPEHNSAVGSAPVAPGDEELIRMFTVRPPLTGVERDVFCKRTVKACIDATTTTPDRKTRAILRRRFTDAYLRIFGPVPPPTHAERAEREERQRHLIAEAHARAMDGPAASSCYSEGSPGCHFPGERDPLEGLTGLFNGRV